MPWKLSSVLPSRDNASPSKEPDGVLRFCLQEVCLWIYWGQGNADSEVLLSPAGSPVPPLFDSFLQATGEAGKEMGTSLGQATQGLGFTEPTAGSSTQCTPQRPQCPLSCSARPTRPGDMTVWRPWNAQKRPGCPQGPKPPGQADLSLSSLPPVMYLLILIEKRDSTKKKRPISPAGPAFLNFFLILFSQSLSFHMFDIFFKLKNENLYHEHRRS